MEKTEVVFKISDELNNISFISNFKEVAEYIFRYIGEKIGDLENLKEYKIKNHYYFPNVNRFLNNGLNSSCDIEESDIYRWLDFGISSQENIGKILKWSIRSRGLFRQINLSEDDINSMMSRIKELSIDLREAL